MIKTILTGMFLILLSSGCNFVQASAVQVDSIGNYSLTGKIPNYNNEWIYLRHEGGFDKNNRTDSAKILNGEFTFSGKISGMSTFYLGLHAKDNFGRILPSIIYKGLFILSSGQLYLEDDLNGKSEPVIFGTYLQDEYNAFKLKVKPLHTKVAKIFGEVGDTKKSNTKKLDSLNALLPLLSNQMHEMVVAHVAQHTNSLVSAYVAKAWLIGADVSVIRQVYGNFSHAVKESQYGKLVLEMLKSAERTALNSIAPAFTIPDSNGKLVSLESGKGTYTLIDFWASWCQPCRQENPSLISVYDSYRTKGFKIIGISMDTSKDAWLKAVKEDKLTWLQLSDLKGVKSEIGKEYGITGVPMNFLIDKDGKIIGRNLRGKELIDKLDEVFNSK